MAIDIRNISPTELETYLGCVEAAFGHQIRTERVEELRHVVEPDRSIVAEEGGSIVGTTGAFSFSLSVPGGEIPAAGVTMVGVLPTHRRRGVLTRMMRYQLLEDVAARGEPLAILWASEAPIYPRFGYGLASLGTRIDIERERAAFLTEMPPGVRFRLVDEHEAIKTLDPIYERVRSRTPGLFARSEAWWRYHRLSDEETGGAGAGPLFRVVAEVSGDPAAYALYRVHSRWEEGVPSGHLEVIEAVADGPAATRALWGFLFNVDLIRRIECWGLPADHPLIHMVAEPRRLKTTLSDSLWARIVDLPAALRARSYLVDGSLELGVRDELLPANSGVFRLAVAGGSATCQPSSAGPDLSMGIAELGAMYLGGTRASTLVRAGRITEHAEGAARQADALFAWETTPWCQEIF